MNTSERLDLVKTSRQQKFEMVDRSQLEHLPPHDDEAEQGTLGAILVSATGGAINSTLAEVLKRTGTDNPFYVSANRTIFHALREMHGAGEAIDSLTLHSRLRDQQKLDDAGGMAYIASLGDSGLPTMVGHYLEIVWEKYLARQLLEANTSINNQILETNGVSEPLLARSKRLQEEIEHKSRRSDITPQYLTTPQDFAEEFWAQFYGGGKDEPGLVLPIPFPLKIRYREASLVSGDDGSGKSTVLSFFALHLLPQMQPGEKIFIASMEMPPAVTLWILASQLLGSKHQPDSSEGHKRVIDAIAWLNARFLFYNFTGIADWRELLDTMEYAATHKGMKIAVLDSAMRMGIADDDYATQGVVSARIAQSAKDLNTHTFIVIHENKGDGSGKQKVRGSKLWTANMDNVLQVKRNEKKGEDIGKIQWNLDQAQRNGESTGSFEKDLNNAKRLWDTDIVLRKQRYPGTRQNGSKKFWFDRESFQFRADYDESAINWLERWKKRREKP
jgi:hypothetical protein